MRKIGPILCLCLSFSATPVYAGVTDPVPLYQIVSLEKSGHFFCPLIKEFYNDQNEIAAQTLMLEALGEGFEGMVAVGEVIRNREKLFSKSPEEVCLIPKQFSAWNDPSRAEEFLKKYRDYYFIALTAWLESEKSAFTNGATDYHTVSIHPYWADAYRVAARIKHHIFYRRIDN